MEVKFKLGTNVSETGRKATLVWARNSKFEFPAFFKFERAGKLDALIDPPSSITPYHFWLLRYYNSNTLRFF
jgi:hypothetical protein